MSRQGHGRRDERRRLEAAFRRSLAVAGVDGPGTDDVAAYVDGSMDAEDRAAFEEMMALDAALRDEVDDVRALRAALLREAAPSWRWAAWTGLAAAAGLAAMLLWRAAPPDTGTRPTTPALAPPVAQLRDGGRDVALRSDGSIAGLPSLPLETRAAVVAALRDGELRQPDALGPLRGSVGTLMGAGDAATLRVLSPLATFVRSDRPTFRWTGHKDARAYELVVFDEALAKVGGVRVAGATEATLPQPLARGRTYVWQVAAVGRKGRTVAPAPPEPEARFRVLGDAEAAALDRALAVASESDLVAAVLLARAGVRDEAEDHLARLVAANPGSGEAARLLAAVRR